MTFSVRFALLGALVGCNPMFGPPPEPHSYFRSQMRTTCESQAVVAVANEASVDADALEAMGVHPRGAANLVAKRDEGFVFRSVADVDAVSWIGEGSIDAMVAANAQLCDFVPDPDHACMETTVAEMVSAPDTDEADLTAIGMTTRAARELLKVRNGLDGVAATSDDVRFDDLDAIDRVPQVGPSTMADLTAWGLSQCQTSAEVIFSPQAYADSHLARVVASLDEAERSVDIAMYSLRDGGVIDAIERAAARGVTVRAVLEGASDDRRDPQGTLSADFEDLGIEVRWINRIMHHKFAIVDGPTEHANQAGTGLLITGSGNWSHGAGTRFDENTLFIEGDARLNLQFQREFNLMWNHGRPVVWNEAIDNAPAVLIEPRDLAAADGASAVFTSANFEGYEHSTYGPTFRLVHDSSVAEDALVQLIEQADSSIRIASGHLRSRAIFEALATKFFQHPEVEIQVYLDGQEYISQGYHQGELAEHEACLAEAVDADDIEDCDQDGYYFGIALANLGVDVRYKYYAYRWDYRYADQMHHKYLIVDDEIVATGSYNFSPNAEYATFENIVFLHAGQYRGVVASFVNNFETMWQTERDDELSAYWELLYQIVDTDDDFPIVFTPMALTHDEVAFLKSSIWENCPDVNSDAYRDDPGSHRWCER